LTTLICSKVHRQFHEDAYIRERMGWAAIGRLAETPGYTDLNLVRFYSINEEWEPISIIRTLVRELTELGRLPNEKLG
jgi:hypothetical protein